MINQIKLLWHYLLPKNILTQFAGILANSKVRWLKNYLIQDFVKKYPVNMQEALEPNPLAYENFNAFFTRHLRPDARKIASNRMVSPADGFISQGGKLLKDKLLQAKGIYYTVEQLLASPDEAKKYEDGDFLTIYLSPKDYHRIHMPLAAKLVKQTYVPGTLFSVQPFTTEYIPGLFTRNERLVLHFETDFGPMALVMVGATIVGCMGTTWDGDLSRQNKIHEKIFSSPISLEKAQELGYFKLGSTVIMVFPKQAKILWQNKLTSGSPIQMGQVLAD